MNYIDIFKQICNIPRPSHHEEAVADFLCRFAEERNLDYERDEHNCVVIRKPASPGYEDRDPIVLLNHTDMVCVADEGYNVPGSVTPIIYNENDETWMRADHTSLGADNGIGLSMALALLDDDTLQHPTLEVLCTACEEDDMSGAANLAPDFIKGRCVLNLDSENYNAYPISHTAGAAHRDATGLCGIRGERCRWKRRTQRRGHRQDARQCNKDIGKPAVSGHTPNEHKTLSCIV